MGMVMTFDYQKRLLLFDIDCTLLITHGAGRTATHRAMVDVFGVDSNLVERYEFGGQTDWQVLMTLQSQLGVSADEIERRMPAYNQAMADHLQSVIRDYPVTACPGAVDLIAELRQNPNVRLGLVTGNVSCAAPVKLRAAGFDPADFPVGAYGDEAWERNKLPPLAVQRAEQHYRETFAPGQIYVIGDTPNDVACARAIGAVAVAVGTGFGSREALIQSNPDYFLEDLTTFCAVL